MGKGEGLQLKGWSRRLGLWSSTNPFALAPRRSQGGWTLIELVITMTVLAVLSMGVIPMVKTAVRRHREQQLRESLREMREAIKEFRRDALNSPYLDAPPGIPPGAGGQVPGGQVGAGQVPTVTTDPRSKMAIADKTLFGVDNTDRYPPKLETLVEGVSVAPRVQPVPGTSGDGKLPELGSGAVLATQKKVYLRKIPIDPMTGKAEWGLRSCYDSPDSGSWGGENVFDVYSKSQDTALNGQKYSDW
jgi:general secretion pathway protein G